MDGSALLYDLRNLLREIDGSDFMDNRTSYTYLYEAAVEFAARTLSIRASQSITTVADQSNYNLNGDFLKLYMQDSGKQFFIRYSDGTTTYELKWRDYEKIYFENNSTSQTIPDSFTIIPSESAPSQLTGTATSAGAASAGQATLTDSAADFTDAWPGDVVHNTTDASTGFVLSKTSTTALVTALFGGTDNDWDSSDAYVIQPGNRFQLVLDPPPDTASHTVTVPYVQRPNPVFSDYGQYRIPQEYHMALVKYAAFLYKYRDDEPNQGDAFFQYWDRKVRDAYDAINGSLVRKGQVSVSWKAKN